MKIKEKQKLESIITKQNRLIDTLSARIIELDCKVEELEEWVAYIEFYEEVHVVDKK